MKPTGVDAFPLFWPHGWPRTDPANRKRADFKVKADQVRLELLNELKLLGGKSSVVSSNVPLRRDGTPLADISRNAIPDPGVAVYFMYLGKPMVMARDVHTTPVDNMRSLYWALSSLRALERHGGSFMMERAFQGFIALPSPSSPQKTCWTVLGLKPGASEADINTAYRSKARDAHPDSGGSTDAMAELNRARDEAMNNRAA